MTDSYNQKYDYLIKELTNDVTKFYLKNLANRREFNSNDVDTSPLLNLTLSVFVSSLINILEVMKKQTIGEIELIENINMIKETITKAVLSLPFIKNVEEI